MDMHTLLALGRAAHEWTKDETLEGILARAEYSYMRWGDASDAASLTTAIHMALIFDRHRRHRRPSLF